MHSNLLAFSGSTTGYGWAGLSPANLAHIISKAMDKIKDLQGELGFDAIAFTGSSGAAIAFPMAVAHKIPLIYVRKAYERSHGSKIEYISEVPIHKYLIVDDFTDSGSTVRRIYKKILAYSKNNGGKPPECVGAFFYEPTCHDSPISLSSGKRIKIYS